MPGSSPLGSGSWEAERLSRAQEWRLKGPEGQAPWNLLSLGLESWHWRDVAEGSLEGVVCLGRDHQCLGEGLGIKSLVSGTLGASTYYQQTCRH